MLGKKTGSSKGKGGSMHYYNAKNNFYGGNGIVGAQMPVGTGNSLLISNGRFGLLPEIQEPKGLHSQHVRGWSCQSSKIVIQGQLFEASNMAALWSLPIIYICENNNYAMGTSNARSTKNKNYHARDTFIPGIKCDG